MKAEAEVRALLNDVGVLMVSRCRGCDSPVTDYECPTCAARDAMFAVLSWIMDGDKDGARLVESIHVGAEAERLKKS